MPNQVDKDTRFLTHKCVTLNISIKIYEKKTSLHIGSPVYLDSFLALPETPIYSQTKGLTLEQVKNSLNVSNDKKKESAITAKKVRQVGVIFPLTSEIEAELRASGATDELIEAIRQNSLLNSRSITQSLNIFSTPPECEIFIDEVQSGRTNAEGIIKIADLPVGEHRIAVRKARYKEAVFSLSLVPDKEGEINANLELAVGFLTVKTNVQNSSVDISGLGRFDTPVSKLECLPGKYTVTISGSLYLTSKKDVIVSTGQEAELTEYLSIDTNAFNRLASEALKFYSRRQFDRAITAAKTLLAADPNDVQSLTMMAQSYFMKDDFNLFAEFAGRAIEAGGSLEFPLNHYHFFGQLHLVKLTITSKSISFDPQVEQDLFCSFRKFNLPIETVVSAQVEEAAGRSFSKRPEGIYLKLTLKDAKNPKKTNTLNFTDPNSSFMKIEGGELRMESRAAAARALSAIAALLNRA